VNKRVRLLILIGLTAWVVAAYPAFVLGGEAALIHSAVALALCLVPAAATLLWATGGGTRAPEQQLALVLGGTGLRMGVALGVGLLLYLFVPLFAQSAFWVWLLVFYLLTLTVEVVLVVKGPAGATGPQQTPSSRSAT
jgi:hypothetical protein